ncbi:MAG: hypothetical protein Q9187_003396 [Circinaria calcarea]
MRYTLILPWLTVVTALPNLHERDSFSSAFYEAETTYLSERNAFPDVYVSLRARDADPNIKEFWKGFKKGFGGVMHVAKEGAAIAGSLAPFIVKRDADADVYLYERDTGLEAWLEARKALPELYVQERDAELDM